MTDVFISYSTADETLARGVHTALTQVGAKPFLASLSLQPGVNWTEEIFENLRRAEWVFFIASKAACASHAVQQELGASLVNKKHIIPILIDIAPEDLPGWTKNHQAIDMRHGPDQLRTTIGAIGEKIKENKFWGGVLLGGLAIGLLASMRS